MFSSLRKSSGQLCPKLLLMVGSTVIPFAFQVSVFAQVPTVETGENSNPVTEENSSEIISLTLPAGTKITVQYPNAEKILVAKDETMALVLTVAEDIRDRQGQVVIPQGSKIRGELEPNQAGTRFVAAELVIAENQTYGVQATSETVTRTETLEKNSEVGENLKNTALSVAAATLAAVMEGKTPEIPKEMLGVALLEVISGLILQPGEAELVAIQPNQDLHLTLLANLEITPEN